MCGNYKVAYSGHNTQLENEFDHLDADSAAAVILPRKIGAKQRCISRTRTMVDCECRRFSVGFMLRSVLSGSRILLVILRTEQRAFHTKPKMFIGFVTAVVTAAPLLSQSGINANDFFH